MAGRRSRKIRCRCRCPVRSIYLLKVTIPRYTLRCTVFAIHRIVDHRKDHIPRIARLCKHLYSAGYNLLVELKQLLRLRRSNLWSRLSDRVLSPTKICRHFPCSNTHIQNLVCFLHHTRPVLLRPGLLVGCLARGIHKKWDGRASATPISKQPVSYTHLTLPTSDLV